MHQYYNFKWLNNNYIRNWDSFENSILSIEENPGNEKDFMFWEDDEFLKRKIINLFENYVFILRSSFVVVYDEYLYQINKTIELIEIK